MALQVVPTKNPSDTWSPAEHNTYIRENFMACVPGIYTAKGDLFIGSGANAGTVRTVGANNTVLRVNTSDGLKVVWGSEYYSAQITAQGDLLAGTAGDTIDNLPVGTAGQILSALDAGTGGMGLDWIDKVVSYARYQTNAGQTLTEPEIIDFEDQIIDTSSAVTTGANWRYTAPAAGYYLVIANILTTVNADLGTYYLRLYKNGSLDLVMAYGVFSNSLANINKPLRGATLILLDATNYIDIRGGSDGGNITLVSDGNYNYVAIYRLGIS